MLPKRQVNQTTRSISWWFDSANEWEASVGIEPLEAGCRRCGYHRVLRVARTLADLEGVAAVRRFHSANARRAILCRLPCCGMRMLKEEAEHLPRGVRSSLIGVGARRRAA